MHLAFVSKVWKYLPRKTCKNIYFYSKTDRISAQVSDNTETTLSDHYGVRAAYCLDSRTVDSIPPPSTAVSTGSNNIEDSGASSAEVKLLVLVFSLVGVFLSY
jgi:hypothetical protein